MADQRLPFLTQEVEIPPPSTSTPSGPAKFNTYFSSRCFYIPDTPSSFAYPSSLETGEEKSRVRSS